MLRLLAGLLLAVAATHGIAISHQDLEGGNRLCGDKSNCEFTRDYSTMTMDDIEVNWNERNCMCDEDCSTYGDCCPDSCFFDIDEQRRGVMNFECISIDIGNSFYMKTTCPPTWGDHATRNLCETITSSERDPIRLFPVTSKINQVTYRNIYCAVCHGELKHDVWLMQVTCPNIPFNADLSVENVISLIQYDDQMGEWVILYDGTFNMCTLEPVLPEILTPYVRPCLRRMVQMCAANWTGAEERSRCEAYTSVVYDYLGTPYRNVHCAVCNYIPFHQLQCFGNSGVFTAVVIPFTLLFDAFRGGGRVGQKMCEYDQLFDLKRKDCFQIFRLGRGAK